MNFYYPPKHFSDGPIEVKVGLKIDDITVHSGIAKISGWVHVQWPNGDNSCPSYTRGQIGKEAWRPDIRVLNDLSDRSPLITDLTEVRCLEGGTQSAVVPLHCECNICYNVYSQHGHKDIIEIYLGSLLVPSSEVELTPAAPSVDTAGCKGWIPKSCQIGTAKYNTESFNGRDETFQEIKVNLTR